MDLYKPIRIIRWEAETIIMEPALSLAVPSNLIHV